MRTFAACAVALAGCAQISGLDVLDVADAGADAAATGDSALDAPQTTDAAIVVDAHIDAGDALAISDAPKDALKESAPPSTCAKPADCTITNSVCCETLVTSGQSSTCTLDADTVVCAAASACPTTIAFNCGKDVLRRCTATSDCTEASFGKCCTVPVDGVSTRQVCLSSGIASLLNGTCL